MMLYEILTDINQLVMGLVNRVKESISQFLFPTGMEQPKVTPKMAAQFAVSDLYEQAENSHIAIGRLAGFPKTLVVVSGSKKNMLQVTQYGTRSKPDKAARNPLKNIEAMAGTQNIINMQEELAINQRKKIKPFLTSPDYLNNAFIISRDFFRTVMDNWQSENSFQDHVTYFTVNVIGRCVLGLPEINFSEAQLIRRANQLIGKGMPDSDDFQEVARDISRLNDNLLTSAKSHIIGTENYTREKAELNGDESDQKILEKLKLTRSISNLLVEINLTPTVAAGIMHLHRSDEIRNNLLSELKDNNNLSIEKIRKLPYLDCIYKETLRFVSPTAVIVREVSKGFDLSMSDNNEDKQEYHIPNHSLLFAPIRRIHHDPTFWENPETFDPSRFAKVQSDEHFMPFSLGTRSCPAASNFNEIVFKTAILESLNYHYVFDKPLEEISADALSSQWKQEYFAEVTPCYPENQETVKCLVR